MNTSAPATLTPHESRARTFVAELARGDWAHERTPFDVAMSAAMPNDGLRALWQKLEEDSGRFKGVDHTSLETKGDYRIVLVRCTFERRRQDVRVVFDKDDRVAGLFHAPAVEEIAWVAPSYARSGAFEERPVQVGTAPALPGTLSVPNGAGPFPAVVLVHGSGPNDRDETIGGVKPFKDLAWGLASKGIAVLRYEKRSRHAPAGILTQKEEVLDGAHDAIELLRHAPDVDSRRIFVVGHSQGGYLAPRIAHASPGLAGVVVLAGSTRPLEESIVQQLRYFASLDPTSTKAKAMVEAAIELEKKVQSPALRADDRVELFLGGAVTGAYFLDVRGYEPAVVAAKLSCPLFVLQGERDYQVTMTDFAGWKKHLATKSNVTLRTYPALNHLFVSGTGTPSPAEYQQPAHLDEGVVIDIAEWINTVTR